MEDQNSPPINGRPPIEIDWQEFDRLCEIHCTKEEIAYVFNCSKATIDRKMKEKWGVTFEVYYAHVSVGGRLSLRRKMWDHALIFNNAEMQRFLSKQPIERGGLGFADKIVSENYDGKGEYEKMMGIVQRHEERKRKESEEDDGN